MSSIRANLLYHIVQFIAYEQHFSFLVSGIKILSVLDQRKGQLYSLTVEEDKSFVQQFVKRSE